MTNSNSFDNNFDSIDAEFGINNNSTTEVITMTNSNSFDSIDSEFGLTTNNSETTMNTNTSDNAIDTEFDLNSDVKVIFTKNFPVYGAIGSDVSPTLTIRFNDKTNEISWGGKTYRLAPKLISVTCKGLKL